MPIATNNRFKVQYKVSGNAIYQLDKNSTFSGIKPRVNQINGRTLRSLPRLCVKFKNSLKKQFSFQEELRENGNVIETGLRPPQIGALHAALAHWKVTDKPATIVMPTGTGKTETMLALTVCQKLDKILVVVPTDTLREQISNKFIGLGLLKNIGVVGKKAFYPLVGVIEHRFDTTQEAEVFFDSCDVVISTMSVINKCSEDIQKAIANACSHLFIDEAHHIAAPTWQKFKSHFNKKPILQFTATPFRGDGKPIDGKVIFNYPLRKAQAEGYFKPIDFLGIRDYNFTRADESLAKKAIEKLETDLAANLNHMLLARANSITRAKELFELYKSYGAKHNPILIHSRIPKREKTEALKNLHEGQSKIIVCVDMFGEGFDMPELKIAAMHDIHKSLAITLQFTGRFTRTREDIGNATVLANIANAHVEESLKELYAEDPDWNILLRDLSEGATGKQERFTQFVEGFTNIPDDFLIQNILPKMSTVVFRTHCTRWNPEKIKEVVKESKLYVEPTTNTDQKVSVFVTCEKEPIEWGNFKGMHNTIWDLYLLHWDSEKGLLYINSSNNRSFHLDLARAVAGEDVQLIRGEEVFRVLHGLERLVLMNIGLTDTLNRNRRFTMYVGTDVLQAITDAEQQGRVKSNVFGRGYEIGNKSSIGCSYRGRIWSHKIASNISEWLDWCNLIGSKITDSSISIDDILKYVLIPKIISTRPNLVPLSIDWSEDFLQNSEDAVFIIFDQDPPVPLFEVGIELSNNSNTGPIKFKVFSENKSAEYEIKYLTDTVEYTPLGTTSIQVKAYRKQKTLSEWFQTDPPIILFENGAYLEYNSLFNTQNEERSPYDKDKIIVWDWAGIDLKKESQTAAKIIDSIQYKVIQNLLAESADPQYDILFDDDDSYEAADVVGIKIAGERLLVHLYHCKFSSEDNPGARIEDLYAVCGQAQKSIHWKGNIQGLFNHLILREIKRQSNGGTRFEKGDLEKLGEISDKAPFLEIDFKIFVVQPGLSKNVASEGQLDLLSVTELYLLQTYAISFGVISSE